MYVPDDITISWTCTQCQTQYTQVLLSSHGMVAIEPNGTQVVLQRADPSGSEEA